MKYKTLTIKPSNTQKGTWDIIFHDLPGDREEGPGVISSLGFFHYPSYMAKEEAFAMLKEHMVQRHQEEIDKLLRSLVSLKKLDFKTDV